MLNKTDRELIEKVARVWVEGGGDEAGFGWRHYDIKKQIRKEIEERDVQREREGEP